jgi:hypothetical protein
MHIPRLKASALSKLRSRIAIAFLWPRRRLHSKLLPCSRVVLHPLTMPVPILASSPPTPRVSSARPNLFCGKVNGSSVMGRSSDVDSGKDSFLVWIASRLQRCTWKAPCLYLARGPRTHSSIRIPRRLWLCTAFLRHAFLLI